MFALNKVPYRLALTGTPAPGKPYDIFAILKFLEPTLYRSEWNFKNEYFIPEYKRMYVSGRPVQFTDFNSFRPGMQETLQRHLQGMSTQRKRKDVMPWLPDKDYIKVKLDPTVIQARELKKLHSILVLMIGRLRRYEDTTNKNAKHNGRRCF